MSEIILSAKSIILVHGAWAGCSSWSQVIPLLSANSRHAVEVQLSLTPVADDVSAVGRAIVLAQGPIVLVGHSYGVVVISGAGGHTAMLAPPEATARLIHAAAT